MSEKADKKVVASAPSGRLTSIDALRGFDMFWIMGGGLVVQALLTAFLHPVPEAVGRQFTHVPWAGFYCWDLIMPLFLFITGASIPFAMSKHIKDKTGRGAVYLRLLKRFVLLFILGMCVQGNLLKFDPSKIYFYSNTLQAIACGYVIACVAVLNMGIVWQVVSCFALLIGYLLLMQFVPVPGHGAGVVLPDANLALYVDSVVLGRFRDTSPGYAYTWVLSSMTFGSTVMFGMFSGHILKSKLPQGRKLVMLVGAGAACTAAGLILGHWFPIIKHIWSSSFTLFSAGLCFLLLAIFYGVIDVLGVRRWSFFFVVIGANSLFTYLFSEYLLNGMPKSVGDWFQRMPIALSSGLGLLILVLLWLLLYYMYKRKWFLRV